MKDELAKKIAGKMKGLPDHMKKDFMKKFYNENKDHPKCDELCNQMKEMIGYGKDDYR